MIGDTEDPRSAKTALRFSYDYARRDYQGAVVTSSFRDRSDKLRTGLIAFDWQPMNSVSLSASLSNERRSSNQSGNDYKDTTANINAQLSF